MILVMDNQLLLVLDWLCCYWVNLVAGMCWCMKLIWFCIVLRVKGVMFFGWCWWFDLDVVLQGCFRRNFGCVVVACLVDGFSFLVVLLLGGVFFYGIVSCYIFLVSVYLRFCCVVVLVLKVR